ncbi:hypothetical protein KM043_016603 [Ampulex compressa]|nr:hypothetical protein KM043_016603 [Ampulex compressa]
MHRSANAQVLPWGRPEKKVNCRVESSGCRMDIEVMLQHMLLADYKNDLSNEEFLRRHIDAAVYHPPPLIQTEKRNCIARSHKATGDEYLEKCMYQKAVVAYTDAIRISKPKSKNMSTYYYYRAIVLQRMKAYDDALLDLDRALQLSPKDETRNKIEEARKKTLELMSKNVNKNKRGGQASSAHDDVQVSYGENPEVPGASSAINILYNKKFGRFIEATKPIAAGDVLLAQEPYMFSMFLGKETAFCHNCLKPSLALIPCDSCTEALYCSAECRTEAYDKYHRTECQFSDCNSDIRALIRLFLIVTKQGACLKEMLEYAKAMENSAGSRTAGFVDGKFDGSTAQAVLSLTNHKDKRVYFDFTSSTAVATVFLAMHTDLLNGYRIHEIGNFMFELMCTYKMNAVMIRDGHLESIAAIALYPVFNLLNHSCANNTIWYTSKNNCRVLLASRDIKPGEQIFNNYLGQRILIQDVTERKEFLSTIKHFTCECEPCQKNYTFKRELTRLKVPVRVQRLLRKNPINIEGMWQVLKHLYQERSAPCMEIELMKFCLMEAYMNTEHRLLQQMYRGLGVL